MYSKVLVANRGAIASKLIRVLRGMGISSVAVYSDADKDLPYISMADEAYHLGGPAPRDSYLNQEALLNVARTARVDAIHPGYGFLSEDDSFARKVVEAGFAFIGPSPKWIELMGDKTKAREYMRSRGMPMSRSSPVFSTPGQDALDAARSIGYPVLIKPAHGGGGIGMVAVHEEAQLLKGLVQAQSVSQRSFGNSDIYLESLFPCPRHIEFQVLADRYGNAMHLFERDCSIQRRHQKIIEEAFAPNVSRDEISNIAKGIADIFNEIGYDVIGTVEMLRDQSGRFQFLEVNARLQVEHAVTEAITGVNLIEAQIRLSSGAKLKDVIPEPVTPKGHAIELRLYAEDPVKFFPSVGTLQKFSIPKMNNVEIETGYQEGSVVSPYYDPLLAKIIGRGETREETIATLIEATQCIEIQGIKSNLSFLERILKSEEFCSGTIHTGFVDDFRKRCTVNA
ncbi:ATP-grasp domain-containing protein [Paralcaligenes sp. KSB-10]|uniref:acetyl-CoA carboxylase biotin carboxylase subunit n=1 Tax=Paralcaligenes sp. KSB-10 TaxID=2901142 RepID=UPI001E3C6C75|nr:biotin carboxylase N-terminal domain-containing protein [Paralcaligenes sp. KSB-10]UHL64224.1 ATP-grasp domain-containing protein [Paralcaligenes sp. KSB-10]